jgi:hypothetical protein
MLLAAVEVSDDVDDEYDEDKVVHAYASTTKKICDDSEEEPS